MKQFFLVANTPENQVIPGIGYYDMQPGDLLRRTCASSGTIHHSIILDIHEAPSHHDVPQVSDCGSRFISPKELAACGSERLEKLI